MIFLSLDMKTNFMWQNPTAKLTNNSKQTHFPNCLLVKFKKTNTVSISKYFGTEFPVLNSKMIYVNRKYFKLIMAICVLYQYIERFSPEHHWSVIYYIVYLHKRIWPILKGICCRLNRYGFVSRVVDSHACTQITFS